MFQPVATIYPFDSGPFTHGNVRCWIRRLDLIDPVTGGNKLFKLKYNLQKASQLGFYKIATFGGAYSNHIAATARLGKMAGFETVGLIRGESASISNNTLTRAVRDGMKLIFMTREDYRRKNEIFVLNTYLSDAKNYFLIPEGGNNAEGMKGCMELLNKSDSKFDYIAVCAGTGTTAAGIAASMFSHQQLLVFSVLNDNGFLDENIKLLNGDKWVNLMTRLHIIRDYIFGGYAKSTIALKNFQNNFNIPDEPVYTRKMFYGINDMVNKNYFPSNSNILIVHTGGLQYLKAD